MPRGLLSLLPALLLTACGDGRLPQLEIDGGALGTTFNVSIVEPPETLDPEAVQGEILATLDRIDRLASTWRDDSELSILNADRSIDWIIVSPGFCSALESALELGRVTDGAFDVTVGPLVNLWGFGPNGQVLEPPSDESIAAARERVGYSLIETDCGEGLVRKGHAEIYVDLSGWAKGLAVDEVAEMLAAQGLEDYLVEIGGEIRVSGHNSDNANWALAVEAPSTSQRIPHAIVRVTDTSVATSGDYRNYFEHGGTRYSHTIDPRSGRPVTHDLAAVTVVHESAAYADALATALLVLGPQDGPALAQRLEIAAYFLIRSESGITEIASPEFDRIGLERT
jgi:thiamine biosynthesis lipoprotein